MKHIKLVAATLCAAPALASGATALLGPFRIDVPARGFEEHCVKLESGEAAHYRFRASGAVDFNVHHHPGNEAVYLIRTAAIQTAEGEFAAPRADTYCLMWERKADGAVRIDGVLERQRR
ncbi:MAG TPA: hypothetical protein VMK32_10305 [Burkholderiaceae bacterium]|nr:hypothetical protein [Burkholderiaceae bacterium]